MSSIELTPHRAWAPEMHLSSLAVIRVTAVRPPKTYLSVLPHLSLTLPPLRPTLLPRQL